LGDTVLPGSVAGDCYGLITTMDGITNGIAIGLVGTQTSAEFQCQATSGYNTLAYPGAPADFLIMKLYHDILNNSTTDRDSILKQISDTINSKYVENEKQPITVNITGHSMGAAIGQIVYAYILQNLGRKKVSLQALVFAPPCVTTAKGGDAINKQPWYDFRNIMAYGLQNSCFKDVIYNAGNNSVTGRTTIIKGDRLFVGNIPGCLPDIG
jgi:hypothetical protein